MGLLGSLFSSSSSSASSSSTTSNSYDQRSAGDNGATVVGPGAVYTDEFSTEVAAIFSKMIDFASGALSSSAEASAKAIASNEEALSKVVAQVQRNNEATSPTLVSFIPYVIGIIVLIIFLNVGRRKK